MMHRHLVARALGLVSVVSVLVAGGTLAVAQTPKSGGTLNVMLREDLSRFVFEPSDVVVAVGQDGLVANVAKYLSGQPVLGVNPDPDSYDGILVPHRAGVAKRLLLAVALEKCGLEAQVLAAVTNANPRRFLGI